MARVKGESTMMSLTLALSGLPEFAGGLSAGFGWKCGWMPA